MGESALDLLAFAGIMALGQFSPGPDMLLLTRTSLAEGGKAGVATALGIATGLCVHGALAIGGMAVALEQSPVARRFLMWVAGAYLLWLGYKLLVACWQAHAHRSGPLVAGPALRGSAYLRGLWCNLLNPKALIFLAAVITPFLRGEHSWGWLLALWSIVAIQSGILWALWAVVLQWRPLRRSYEKAQPVIDGLFGVGLVLLAVKLAIG
jgi:threonine efflux protein